MEPDFSQQLESEQGTSYWKQLFMKFISDHRKRYAREKDIYDQYTETYGTNAAALAPQPGVETIRL